MRSVLIVAGALAISSVVARPAAAQSMTRCAACHFANLSSVPAPEHLGEWQQSAHARATVGCDKCHGGDPWTEHPVEAHRGVLHPANPLSPVNPANLVETCGRCHRENARASASSLHQTLVRAGERRAPNCTTCHGAMRAQVPSPSALEARCAECHPAASPRGAYPALMRAGIESLDTLRVRADALDDDVARVPERARRVELLVALHDARLALKEAVAAVHTFDTQKLNERLTAARAQLDTVAAACGTSGR
jgi:hypothetical protein